MLPPVRLHSFNAAVDVSVVVVEAALVAISGRSLPEAFELLRRPSNGFAILAGRREVRTGQ